MTDYQTALGIETGDIVTTSYHTGPYVVTQINPQKDGTVSLTCRGTNNLNKDHTYWLNGITLTDGRWWSWERDEIFVEKPNNRPSMQMRLFE